ncbi:rhodanese-like domain-containing protein [Micromonospora eburnea]|uniref:Rhodanese-related sulfurtransferase n=1 Tax=Micromonospora eburnea TaxID=227316 RepID=A0A1C6UYJ0_9ACTN|nr:rhodanese-like domain-containing protein [Micromonospora eburnea]SCL58914.1 Rhodanese-related sulfurtransferase [Micromonospora eburnea]
MRLGEAVKRLLGGRYTSVGPERAAALVGAGGMLLDVREPAEWRAGHAPQARHIPLAQLADRIGELPADRPIVTVCRSGARSRRAAARLARDHRQVHNLTGGMRAWVDAGYALQAKGGRPGRLV